MRMIGAPMRTSGGNTLPHRIAWPRDRAAAACLALGLGYLAEQFLFSGKNVLTGWPWFFDLYYALISLSAIVFALNSSVFWVERGRLRVQSAPVPLLLNRPLPMDSVAGFRVSTPRVWPGTAPRRAGRSWLIADLRSEQPWRGRTERWLHAFQRHDEAARVAALLNAQLRSPTPRR